MATINELQNQYTSDKGQRNKTINEILSVIQKKHGEESITKLDSKANFNIPMLSSQILSLDLALGIGGLPLGRIVEVFGASSCGKTTLTLNLIAQAQKKGGIAAFIDAEHALDKKWAKFHGVNVDELLLAQPSNGEEALELVDDLVCTNKVSIIVIDSVAALIPKAELEKDMGESSMGLHARLMSQACRKLTASIANSKCIVIFLNQIRDVIGGYGNPTTTTGGKALPFYSSIRLELSRKETLKVKDEAIGIKVRAKIVKNKVAPPFTECTFDLIFKEGYDFEGSVIEEAVKYEIIKQGGAWYTFNGNKYQGLKGIKEFLKQSPSEIQKIRELILKQVQEQGISEKEVKLVEEPVKRRSEEPVVETKIEQPIQPLTPEQEQKELEKDKMIEEIFSEETKIVEKDFTIEKVTEGENQ